ncbi:MAG: T9SS type A sorting domain-containing protein [Fluviicola sp.]|nr:T9SS type A sorting domain-containing protein [Fluviicola sp.]
MLCVYGMDGKQFHQQKINVRKNQLQLTLKKGVYIVLYKTNDSVETLKLIIN